MKKTKKFLSLLITACMLLSMMPMTTFESAAEETKEPYYLTFTAEEANSTITFSWASGSNVKYKTSCDDNWTTYTGNDNTINITLTKVGDKVAFSEDNVTTNGNKHFAMSGKIAASGDITSLTNKEGGNVNLNRYGCWCMFKDCTALTSAPELPSTTLELSCYDKMFSGCTSLTTAPTLSAEVLPEYCCYEMFSGCTSLKYAPAIHAEN